jgi:hypothetical protein
VWRGGRIRWPLAVPRLVNTAPKDPPAPLASQGAARLADLTATASPTAAPSHRPAGPQDRRAARPPRRTRAEKDQARVCASPRMSKAGPRADEREREPPGTRVDAPACTNKHRNARAQTRNVRQRTHAIEPGGIPAAHPGNAGQRRTRRTCVNAMCVRRGAPLVFYCAGSIPRFPLWPLADPGELKPRTAGTPVGCGR